MTVPRYSLVVGTVGRTSEVARLLASLEAQELRDFELILVDQNADDRLVPLVASCTFPVTYLRTPVRGLSRARNLGIEHVRGEIVAFPDDDCWYAPGLLAALSRWFDQHSTQDGVVVQSLDGQGKASLNRKRMRPRQLDAVSVWGHAISYVVFLRRAVVLGVGPFDVELGVGAGTPWGSGEETDYLLRALKAGFRLWQLPDLAVFHPNPVAVYTPESRKRGLAYGAGMGRVLARHDAPTWLKARALIRAGGGAVVGLAALDLEMAAFHFNVMRGRLRGLRSR